GRALCGGGTLFLREERCGGQRGRGDDEHQAFHTGHSKRDLGEAVEQAACLTPPAPPSDLPDSLLSRARGARDGADDGPVVFVHDHWFFRLRPQLDGEIVDPVTENARLDGQVAHALAEALPAADGTTLDDHAGRFPDTLVDADF